MLLKDIAIFYSEEHEWKMKKYFFRDTKSRTEDHKRESPTKWSNGNLKKKEKNIYEGVNGVFGLIGKLAKSHH